MKILYTLQFSWMKIIVVQFFILSMGLALAHTGFNYSFFTLFFSIPAILFVMYLAIAHNVRTLKFYSDQIVFTMPLKGIAIKIDYVEIQKAEIKHVYNEGAQLIILLQKPHSHFMRIQTDFNRKRDVEVIKILAERGIIITGL